MRTVLCAILVLRLLADLATPHLPGAFQFDPDESVEGLRTGASRAIDPGPPAIGRVPETGERVVVQPIGRRPGPRAVVTGAAEFRPRLARQARDASTDPAEDH